MRDKRWAVRLAVLGSGVVFLYSTVITVALPRIGRELSTSLFGTLEGQSCICNGYPLTLSTLLVLAAAAHPPMHFT